MLNIRAAPSSYRVKPAPRARVDLYANAASREKQRHVEPMTQAAQGLSDDDYGVSPI